MPNKASQQLILAAVTKMFVYFTVEIVIKKNNHILLSVCHIQDLFQDVTAYPV